MLSIQSEGSKKTQNRKNKDFPPPEEIYQYIITPVKLNPKKHKVWFNANKLIFISSKLLERFPGDKELIKKLKDEINYYHNDDNCAGTHH